MSTAPSARTERKWYANLDDVNYRAVRKKKKMKKEACEVGWKGREYGERVGFCGIAEKKER